MTDENRKIWERISSYAEEVLKDIDPQKTQVSVQLDALRDRKSTRLNSSH